MGFTSKTAYFFAFNNRDDAPRSPSWMPSHAALTDGPATHYSFLQNKANATPNFLAPVASGTRDPWGCSNLDFELKIRVEDDDDDMVGLVFAADVGQDFISFSLKLLHA